MMHTYLLSPLLLCWEIKPQQLNAVAPGLLLFSSPFLSPCMVHLSQLDLTFLCQVFFGHPGFCFPALKDPKYYLYIYRATWQTMKQTLMFLRG